MRPQQTRSERLRGKQPPFYAELEPIVYAMKVNPPVNNPFAEIDRFTFFVIFTRVGVGDYGKNIINNVHIRFQFEKGSQSTPDIEIVDVHPTGESREVGLFSRTHRRSDGHIIDAGAKAEANISGLAYPQISGNIGGNIGGNITKRSNSDEVVTIQYPNYIHISSSMGVGNHAIWDFKQGGAAHWTGQYNLQIIFKINALIREIKRGEGSYRVNWNMKINERRLMEENGSEPRPIPIDLLI
jgi:hypothetical protein